MELGHVDHRSIGCFKLQILTSRVKALTVRDELNCLSGLGTKCHGQNGTDKMVRIES